MFLLTTRYLIDISYKEPRFNHVCHDRLIIQIIPCLRLLARKPHLQSYTMHIKDRTFVVSGGAAGLGIYHS